MASSSSSNSSGLSFQSSSSVNREPTPEHPPPTAYEALAPQWWDERDWDFDVWSEDDESLTDGEEDLQFLAEGALEAESADDAISWGEDISSSDEEEEAEEDSSSDEYPPAKRFRAGSSEDTDDDDEDEEAPAANFSSSSEDYAGSSADDSEDGGGEGSGDDAGF
jgi:hypothetical protein